MGDQERHSHILPVWKIISKVAGGRGIHLQVKSSREQATVLAIEIEIIHWQINWSRSRKINLIYTLVYVCWVQLGHCDEKIAPFRCTLWIFTQYSGFQMAFHTVWHYLVKMEGLHFSYALANTYYINVHGNKLQKFISIYLVYTPSKSLTCFKRVIESLLICMHESENGSKVSSSLFCCKKLL